MTHSDSFSCPKCARGLRSCAFRPQPGGPLRLDLHWRRRALAGGQRGHDDDALGAGRGGGKAGAGAHQTGGAEDAGLRAGWLPEERK